MDTMNNKYYDLFSINQRVITSDGVGKIIGRNKRLNTNGGPGTTQFRVQLLDGRIRNYNRTQVEPCR